MWFQTGAIILGGTRRSFARKRAYLWCGVWETTETEFGASVFHRSLTLDRDDHGRCKRSPQFAPGRRTQPFATPPLIGFLIMALMVDTVIQQIEQFPLLQRGIVRGTTEQWLHTL